MTFIPAANVIQIAHRATLFGQRIENGVYFLSDEPITPSVLQTAVTASDGAWQAYMMDVFTPDYYYRETTGTDLTAVDSYSFTLSTSEGETGGDVTGGASLPGNVCIALKFSTLYRGRSGRGRIYLSGLGELRVTGNHLNTADAASILARFDSYRNVMFGAGLTHVIVSRQIDGAPRTVGKVMSVVDVSFSDLVIDSQRRRLNGRGL